jgi:PKD repeat protein
MIIRNALLLVKLFSSALAITGLVMTSGCEKDSTPSSQNLTDASFTYSSKRSLPLNVEFVNQSTSTVPGTSSYIWDFGDGGYSTITNPSHSYTALGYYLVKLVQTDGGGTRDTLVVSLNLSDTTGPSGQASRVSSAAFSYRISNPFKTTFTNTSDNATSYLWNFGDGNTSTSTDAVITKEFTTPGTYRVSLKATGTSTDSAYSIITFN